MLKLKVSCVFVTATQKLCKLHIYERGRKNCRLCSRKKVKEREQKIYNYQNVHQKLLKTLNFGGFSGITTFTISKFFLTPFFLLFPSNKSKIVSSKFAENIKSK